MPDKPKIMSLDATGHGRKTAVPRLSANKEVEVIAAAGNPGKAAWLKNISSAFDIPERDRYQIGALNTLRRT